MCVNECCHKFGDHTMDKCPSCQICKNKWNVINYRKGCKNCHEKECPMNDKKNGGKAHGRFEHLCENCGRNSHCKEQCQTQGKFCYGCFSHNRTYSNHTHSECKYKDEYKTEADNDRLR
jgi:hypothetical protein